MSSRPRQPPAERGDPDRGPGQTPVNYIGVASVEEFVQRASRLGAEVCVPKMPVPGKGWFAQLRDLEGNVFAVWQTDATAA